MSLSHQDIEIISYRWKQKGVSNDTPSRLGIYYLNYAALADGACLNVCGTG
jgi:hypothetical protein